MFYRNGETATRARKATQLLIYFRRMFLWVNISFASVLKTHKETIASISRLGDDWAESSFFFAASLASVVVVVPNAHFVAHLSISSAPPIF